MRKSTYNNLILDLGGVLLFFSASSNTAVPPRTIAQVFGSTYWHEYERGKLSQQGCYDAVSKSFGMAPGVWAEAVGQLASTLTPNLEFINAVKTLKTVFPHLRVHAFSNISAPDFEMIKEIVDSWDIFDSVTTSAAIGCRKPDLDSYRRMLASVDIEPRTSIFVDDLGDNVINAQSLGIRGVQFRDTKAVITQLHNLLGDPVTRGMNFLRQNAKNLFTETDTGTIVKDNFTQLLILFCIGDRDMVTLENEGDCWQFFIGKRFFTDQEFPKDSDTTALALVTLDASDSQKQAAMEMILSYQTPDGLPQLYFDNERLRWCPHISANVLRFFYLNGQGHKQLANLEHLCRLLRNSAFEFDTRYYFHRDWMFWHLADLCAKCSASELDELRALVTTRLQERVGCDKDVLGAAMRVLAAQSLGLDNQRDLKTLLDTQQLDGGWELSWVWRYGTVNVKVGSRGVPTAMAVKAIRTALELEECKLKG